MPTYVMPGVEVTNRYEHVDTPSTHTIVHELCNRNITDSATSWSSECCVPSVNRADDGEFLFFFLFFVRQKEPPRSNHAKNHIETETKHPFTTAEFALKFLRHMLYSVLVQDTLSSQCLAPSRSLNGYLWTDRKKKNLKKCWAGSWEEGGGCHGLAFQPGGELQYFLSLHATETRIGCCWIGILAWVQIYLSMDSIRNKWRAEGLNRGNEVFFVSASDRENSNIALSIITVLIWSFITTLIQSIWSLRTLSANNLKISRF